MSARVTINATEWAQSVANYARVTGKKIEAAFKTQARLLGRELIERTPPRGGIAITRMLSARGATLRDSEVEDLNARQVGVRRVEKDIRKVIYGVKGADLSDRQNRYNNVNAIGVRQMCEGKQAIRVFSTKGGTVYGVDTTDFRPDASLAEIGAHHQANRTRSGRVTMTGQKTRDVGRWKWLNVFLTKEKTLMEYIKGRQDNVGRAKGGWVAGAVACGAKFGGGWIGKHKRMGSGRASFEPFKLFAEFINNSEWARAGRETRVVEESLEGREIKMAEDMKRIIEEEWNNAN